MLTRRVTFRLYPTQAQEQKLLTGQDAETRPYFVEGRVVHLLTNEQVSRFKPIIDDLSPKLNAYLKSLGHGS